MQVIWQVKVSDQASSECDGHTLYHFTSRSDVFSSMELSLRNYPGKIRISQVGPHNGCLIAYDDDTGYVLIHAEAISPIVVRHGSVDFWKKEQEGNG